MLVDPGVLDANILAYAVNADAPRHAASRALVEAARDPSITLYVTSQILCEFLPISAAQPEPIGITLATGLPRFVITMPSAPRSSSRLRHCSLNFEALIRRIVSPSRPPQPQPRPTRQHQLPLLHQHPVERVVRDQQVAVQIGVIYQRR